MSIEERFQREKDINELVDLQVSLCVCVGNVSLSEGSGFKEEEKKCSRVSVHSSVA